MDEETRNLVRRRANEQCEYCGLPQEHSELRHHVEHIVAKQLEVRTTSKTWRWRATAVTSIRGRT